MKNTFYILLFLSVLFTACHNDQTAKKEIENTVMHLYAKPEDLYNKAVDTTLFSKDIIALLQNAQKIKKADEELIKKSDSPTDKPNLIEGSVFNSLYEGFTNYTIKNIAIKGQTASVAIDFENNTTTQEKWTDTIVLVHTNNWKINNIVFSKKYSQTIDLKEKLKSINQ